MECTRYLYIFAAIKQTILFMETMKVQSLAIGQIAPNDGQVEGLPRNPRFIRDEKFEALKRSIMEDPEMLQMRPVMVYPHNGEYVAIGGNMRLAAMKELGYTDVPCVVIPEGTTPDKLRAYTMKDNYGYGEWDSSILADEWDMSELDKWDMSDIVGDLVNEDVEDLPQDAKPDKNKGSLKDRFLMPPFSIFDTRKADWQNRKRMWTNLGLKSDEGRGNNLCFSKTQQPPIYYDLKNILRELNGKEPTHEDIVAEADRRKIKLLPRTSIFDPVLCEVMYKWFNVEGGKIIDPFCGGSVRGIIAGACGYEYHGNDLRQEQVDANYANLKEMQSVITVTPNWHCGDSLNIDEIIDGDDFDMVFSCPPYADIEVYSDKPEDLSNMEYEDFLNTYREIIYKTCLKLKENRFAVFVVGEVRDKKTGKYKNFVADTINAFIDAGLSYYNKIILINPIGSAAITAGGRFDKSRKISKIHQDVLVFFKGNPNNVKDVYSELKLQETIDKYVEEDGEPK